MLAVGGLFGAHVHSHFGFDVAASTSAGSGSNTGADQRTILCGLGPGCE